jgi:chromosome partitioning protein
MSVVSFINLKGGVGKTSACLHLAGALALLGRRVLCVDNDPQSSLSSAFFGADAARGLDPVGTIAAIYAGTDPLPGSVIRPSGFDRIDLLPGSRAAGSYNNADPHQAPHALQVGLRDFLDLVRDRYDLVMIDCPPNLHLCSWAAMTASDAFVVPLQPEDFGAQGVADVMDSASGVRTLVNSRLTLAGILVSMFQSRRAIHQAYVARLREGNGPAVFTAMIPEAVDFVEAVTVGKPVGMHKPKGAAAKAVKAVAMELIERLAAPAVEAGEAA